ncbi:hypothetical protein HOR75_gp51 [Shewanella phage SppYZU05]|uniref:Uncharacterized protein n=1 Tax=Shewanella phage SppYZU05 TaxID=1970795 RepID=A0A1W6JTK4_9CAUD|nr:hypothetical protein HOR75_gp51 [Shewanella phage SppYZU05]ARM70577.1 hypothetical protein SppYZU05_51 [Shewanella phage SppYZU05]
MPPEDTLKPMRVLLSTLFHGLEPEHMQAALDLLDLPDNATVVAWDDSNVKRLAPPDISRNIDGYTYTRFFGSVDGVATRIVQVVDDLGGNLYLRIV